jgi:hypothetical protein
VVERDQAVDLFHNKGKKNGARPEVELEFVELRQDVHRLVRIDLARFDGKAEHGMPLDDVLKEPKAPANVHVKLEGKETRSVSDRLTAIEYNVAAILRRLSALETNLESHIVAMRICFWVNPISSQPSKYEVLGLRIARRWFDQSATWWWWDTQLTWCIVWQVARQFRFLSSGLERMERGIYVCWRKRLRLAGRWLYIRSEKLHIRCEKQPSPTARMKNDC